MKKTTRRNATQPDAWFVLCVCVSTMSDADIREALTEEDDADKRRWLRDALVTREAKR